MSTIMGHGQEYDKTFKAGANLKTTTSQYMVVSMVPGTSTAADITVEACANSGTVGGLTSSANYALGVNQTYISTTLSNIAVRLFGISKVILAESCTAGDFLTAYRGATDTADIGRVAPVLTGASIGAYGATISSYRVVLGRAMENGVTGTVISAFINPQIYDAQFLGES